MTVQSVTCITTEYDDQQANSHKFYRAYVCGRWTVFQWGRHGAVGQWSGTQHATGAIAHNAARDQIAAKEAKGYTRVGTVVFDYDEALLDVDKAHLIGLDNARGLHGTSSAPAPTPTPKKPPKPSAAPTPAPASAPATDDAHALFAARALAAISLAVTDQQKAAEEFAILNVKWKELETQHAKAASYLKTLDQLLIGAS